MIYKYDEIYPKQQLWLLGSLHKGKTTAKTKRIFKIRFFKRLKITLFN